MKPSNTSIYDFRPIYVLLVFSLVHLVLAWMNTQFVMNKDLFYNSLAAKLSVDRIDEILSVQARFQWVSYLAVPIIVFLKVLLVTMCIYTGVVFGNYRITFRNIFNIVLVAETVLILAMLFKLAYLMYRGENTLDEVRSFYPLSVIQLINPQSIPSYAIYPFQLINVFELGYWIVLAAGLRYFLDLSFAKSIKLVMTTYGLGLCLWVLIVIFIQLQFS